MSGNGEKITHKASGIVPAGNGGGCVKTGPFKEYVHLPTLQACNATYPNPIPLY